MEEALVARLLADVALAALVGTRIHWIDRPQSEALDALTLQMIVDGRDYHHGGADDLVIANVQFDSWGRSYLAAKAISRAAIRAVEPATLVGGVQFGQAFLDVGSDMPITDIPGGAKIYRVMQRFSIYYKEL